MRLTDVFLIVFEQQRSFVANRNKINQAPGTCQRDQLNVGVCLFIGFADNKTNATDLIRSNAVIFNAVICDLSELFNLADVFPGLTRFTEATLPRLFSHVAGLGHDGFLHKRDFEPSLRWTNMRCHIEGKYVISRPAPPIFFPPGSKNDLFSHFQVRSGTDAGIGHCY